ncbi:MAG: GntR family transcriptional regulator [Gemmatimonadota bacterium]|jgi:DNA-binding transcriptional regulator YhcF (GntR family)|nr:GntR family transcriptional regulator [Gemmatimonadota bacterium]
MPQRRGEIAQLLRQRVVAGLHLGMLRPGARLPSLRSLASELSADPRVILAAYRQLEAEGLVEVRSRSGAFVGHTAVATGEMLPQMAKWVQGVLIEALARGVPPIEFPERVHRCLRTVRLRAACIECNEDQITGLCAELEKDYGLETSRSDIETLRSAALPEQIQRADLLVTTRYHAAEVQRLAERLGKRWIAISLRAEFLAETARLLEQGPVYFVAKDPRFEGKLAGMFASVPGAGNLRVLITGRDDLSRIPQDAPTYVMQAARGQVKNLSLLARVIPAPRVFSEDSARELLSIILSVNIAELGARDTRKTASPADRP